MKTVCAWCGSTMQITCHCGAPLTPTNYVGSTFDHDSMVCFNGETSLTYSRSALEEMEKTYGICQKCKAEAPEERDLLIAIRRAKDAQIPDDNALARIISEIERTNAHERETRRADRNNPINRQQTKHELRPNELHGKRGPTGVHAAPTVTPPTDTARKRGAK